MQNAVLTKKKENTWGNQMPRKILTSMAATVTAINRRKWPVMCFPGNGAETAAET